MRNIAVINGTDLREPAFRPLRDGRSSFALAVQFALELPGVAETVVLLSRETELPAGARPVVRASWTLASLLEQIAGAAEGFDHVCYLYGDCPFLDSAIARRMQESHVRHWADYTFADGYPAGVTVEILSRQTVGRLRAMADGPEGQAAPRRDSLFTVIRKDINSFDIETEISPTDMRLLRVSLTADTERNFLLLSRIVAAGAVTPEAAIRFLQDNPGAHRTLPAFFPVQVVEQCPQACTYCPYPRFAGDVLHRKGFMPVEAFAGLARKISAFAGDAVIDISLWGEPSLHPQVFDLIQAGRDTPGIELLIETSGIGWPAGTFERIKAQGGTPPRWIVSLDAATEPVYRALRGEGFAEATRTAEELLRLFPDRTWVQAVRMKENEEELDTFYRQWKTRTENVIIQKYDSFHGTLPDRTVADLSPLKRFPCWHLKRDMAILLDGSVPLCREDVHTSVRLGNAFHDELAVIWDSAREIHRSHLSGTYPGICAACDEYYTFNF